MLASWPYYRERRRLSPYSGWFPVSSHRSCPPPSLQTLPAHLPPDPKLLNQSVISQIYKHQTRRHVQKCYPDTCGG